MSAVATGRMIEINGASLQVEEQGTGDPLILAHPGLGAAVQWGGIAPLLARHFRVITFDTRGHGESTNPGGKLSFEQVADDVAAIGRSLELDRPFVGGWSDGGQFALEVGIRHPAFARGLIVGGTGLELGTAAAKAQMRQFLFTGEDDRVDFDSFERAYGDFLMPVLRQCQSAGPDHWKSVVQQSAGMWLAYEEKTPAEIARVQTPVLVLVGDRDEFVPAEEGVRLYRALPNAELAIIPGASHMRPIMEGSLFVDAVLDFLTRH